VRNILPVFLLGASAFGLESALQLSLLTGRFYFVTSPRRSHLVPIYQVSISRCFCAVLACFIRGLVVGAIAPLLRFLLVFPGGDSHKQRR
jgi:hypothetical protein